jgi:hypothetical protein
MLELKYFDDCTPLIKAAWKFSEHLSRCVVCGCVSIVNFDNSFFDDKLSLLEMTCKELNNLNLCVRQLGTLEIFLTGGMCVPCVRQKMFDVAKRRQKKEGFFPCFGTAVDGHCSQRDCKYYSCCVIDRKTLKEWEERKKRRCNPECDLKEYFNCPEHVL